METKTFLSITILLAGLMLIPLSFVKAESGVSLYLNPSEGNYKVGDPINVSVMINTSDETINAVKATLTFNANLEVQSVSKTGSILGLWIEDPSYDNSARIISFGGAGVGTTYKGSAGKLITIVFKAKNSGEGVVNFTSNLVKYGGTTITVKSATGGIYVATVPTPQSQIEETQKPAIEKPVLTPGEAIEEPMSAKEEVVVEITTPEAVAKEAISQQNFLASLAGVWGGTSQVFILLAMIVMGVIFLIYFGAKEWKVFQRKRE